MQSMNCAGSRLRRLVDFLTLAYAGILELATHWPYDPAAYLRMMLRTERPPFDKTLHFVAYAILAGLLWACARLRGMATLRATLAVMAVVAVWAAVDEVTQPFFYRAAEPLDWVYDIVGAAIGCGAMAVLDRLIAGRRRAA
jgi:VanZ family protein